MGAAPIAMHVLIVSGCAWVIVGVIYAALYPPLQHEGTKVRRLQANTSVIDNTSLLQVWLPPVPDIRSLSRFSFAFVRPRQWMPQPAQLTDPTERDNRFIYWRTALVLVGIIGMSVMETYRVAIAAARSWYHKGLEREPVNPNAQEEHVVSLALAKCLHACNQLVCASICGYASFTGHLGVRFGLCYELVLIWLVWTLADLTVQVVVRAATIKYGAKQGTVANKAILAIAPGANDRTDILMDWLMIGVMFHYGGIAILWGSLFLANVFYVYARVYSNTALMEELRDDFFSMLTPQDTGSIGFVDAWRSSRIYDFLVQQAVASTATLKRELAWHEELPQACLKALFVVTCGGGWFVFSYTGFALVKLLGMAFIVYFFAKEGTNKQLLQKFKGNPDMRAVVLETLVERAQVGDGQADALLGSAAGDSPKVFPRRDPEAMVAVLKGIKDEDRAVRETAMKNLSKIFQRGDREAMVAVLKGIEDEDRVVRLTAMRNLPEFFQRGDPEAMTAVLKGIADEDVMVRYEAMIRLPEFFQRGDPEAVAVVLKGIEDEDRGIRSAAMKQLPNFLQSGDAEAVAAVRKGIEDKDHVVREAAMITLEMFCSVEMARSYLKHEDQRVRKRAAEVVSQLGGFSAAERAAQAGYYVAQTAAIGGAVVVGAPIAICLTIAASPILVPALYCYYKRNPLPIEPIRRRLRAR